MAQARLFRAFSFVVLVIQQVLLLPSQDKSSQNPLSAPKPAPAPQRYIFGFVILSSLHMKKNKLILLNFIIFRSCSRNTASITSSFSQQIIEKFAVYSLARITSRRYFLDSYSVGLAYIIDREFLLSVCAYPKPAPAPQRYFLLVRLSDLPIYKTCVY